MAQKYEYRGACQYCDWVSNDQRRVMANATKDADTHRRSAHPDKRPAHGVKVQRILQHAHYEAGRLVGK